TERKTMKKKYIYSKQYPLRKKDKKEKTELKSDKLEDFPKTEDELRRYFFNQLYPFQLKWATSSISHVSFMNRKYNKEADLEYFLKRFPDNYFVMYYPVFNINKVPIDAEIILIIPIHI